MTDLEDRYLDVALEEVLGGRVPPDLSASILPATQASTSTQAAKRLSVAAALLLASTVLVWMLVPRDPKAPVPSAPSQQAVPVIPTPRELSLDFPGGTLKEAANRLSQAAGYPITVADDIATSPLPAIRLTEVVFMEALDAITRPIGGVTFTSSPGRPVSIGGTKSTGGVTITPVALHLREGVGLRLSRITIPGVGSDVHVTLEVEPSHDRFRFAELEILEVRDSQGGQPALKTRIIPLLPSHTRNLGLSEGVPGGLERLRLRARLHYAAEERRVLLTAGREQKTIETDGLRLTTSIQASDSPEFFGDAVQVKVEPLEEGAGAAQVIEQAKVFARGGVEQVLPIGVPKDQWMGPGFAWSGGFAVLSRNVRAGTVKGVVPVEVVLPISVEVRTIDFDLKDLKFR